MRGTPTILANIGAFQEENKGCARLIFLSWILPSIVLATTLLDLVLVFIYMRFLHPWRCILDDEVVPIKYILIVNSQVVPQVSTCDTTTKDEAGSEGACN